MAAWTTLITAIPDALKGLFGLVDKVVEDRDKANELKLALVATMAGKGAQYWLAANAFSIAMLGNFTMVIILHLTGRTVPDWSLWIALAWLAGPLINIMSTSTIGKLVELVREYGQQKGKK